MVEFTLQLLKAFCKNLKACFSHWVQINSDDAQGFLNKWLNENRLRLLCSMLAKCLEEYSGNFKEARSPLWMYHTLKILL